MTTARNTSVQRSKTGRLSGASGWNTSSRVTHSKMLMWNDSIGRYGTNGCRSTIGQTWQRFKTLRRSGCGLTTMTTQTWPWAGSHPGSGRLWLRNVSTSATFAKGEYYRSIAARTSITNQLPADGGLVPIQQIGYLRLIVSGFHEGVNLMSFSLPEMFVFHKQLRLPAQEALNAIHPQPPNHS